MSRRIPLAVGAGLALVLVWVFFRDADSGRGHVLYRRYDGHYGLIVPVDAPD